MLFAILVGGFSGMAQKNIAASRCTSPLKIDGVFSEADWQQARWQSDMVQHEPQNGSSPSQRTEFAVLYDDQNVYVAIFARDSVPGKIENRLSRRDEREGDLVAVEFDSYNDKRTGFMFLVSAAGVKSDAIDTNDGNNEDNSNG